MEKEAFQKRLEDLGELAKINNNRLSTDAVKTFLKDMDLTEEQYNLVFAYLASKMITVEGYVSAAGDGKNGTLDLTEEEQTFLNQYEEDLSYLKILEEDALLELCREVEESGDGDAKAHLTEPAFAGGGGDCEALRRQGPAHRRSDPGGQCRPDAGAGDPGTPRRGRGSAGLSETGD